MINVSVPTGLIRAHLSILHHCLLIQGKEQMGENMHLKLKDVTLVFEADHMQPNRSKRWLEVFFT
jgi:hypothetical protein